MCVCIGLVVGGEHSCIWFESDSDSRTHRPGGLDGKGHSSPAGRFDSCTLAVLDGFCLMFSCFHHLAPGFASVPCVSVTGLVRLEEQLPS